MKKYIFPAAVAFCALSAAFMSVSCEAESEPYAVLAPVSFAEDSAGWEGVVASLQRMHDAEVLRFDATPTELEAQLRALNPRYVAVRA